MDRNFAFTPYIPGYIALFHMNKVISMIIIFQPFSLTLNPMQSKQKIIRLSEKQRTAYITKMKTYKED